ncbi:MAG: MFS transporter [Cardiobacteriaceae bacterium]|nr:MFS transporter [Cardiobacteriaceae bacterium]
MPQPASPHWPLFLATILMLAILYLPQPLQPMLAAQYGQSPASAGLLTTVALVPLAAAPLLYGYLLGKRHPASLLRPALIALALSCIAFAAARHFSLLLAIRFVQGALLPILISAILHLLADAADNRKTLALYVSCTIVGGFCGRLGAAAFATWAHWQIFPLLCGVALFALAFIIRPPQEAAQAQIRPHLADFVVLLRSRSVMTLCFIIFASFSAFVAVLNYLPFIVRENFPDASTFATGMMYSGYLVGAIVSLLAPRITTRFGLKRSFIAASLLFNLSLILLFPNSIALTFAVLFTLCAAIFLLHSVAIVEVVRQSPAPRVLTSAFYTTLYYTGSVFGSSVPGLIYQRHGKTAFLAALLLAAGLGLLAILTLKTHDPVHTA